MDEVQEFVREYRKKSLEMLQAIPEEALVRLIHLLKKAREEERQIFVCGNGGSASTASHLANDLGKGASCGRKLRFRVFSLVDNVSWLSALANDLDYSEIFVEQLKNLARKKDLLIMLSGSGNSANVLKACQWANQNGLLTVALSGRRGGPLGGQAQVHIEIPSQHMGRIEEGHFFAQHVASYFFMECEKRFFSAEASREG